jgi:hypothetical protein
LQDPWGRHWFLSLPALPSWKCTFTWLSLYCTSINCSC